jgi:hypothetical protein
MERWRLRLPHKPRKPRHWLDRERGEAVHRVYFNYVYLPSHTFSMKLYYCKDAVQGGIYRRFVLHTGWVRRELHEYQRKELPHLQIPWPQKYSNQAYNPLEMYSYSSVSVLENVCPPPYMWFISIRGRDFPFSLFQTSILWFPLDDTVDPVHTCFGG